MGNDSSGKQSKNRKPQKAAAKKLHFLLDTIETEVTDLAEVVDLKGPILDEAASSEEGSPIGLSDSVTLMDGVDMDMDLFEESDGSPTEVESADKAALAALDAMSDAEGEIEAMLAEEMAGASEDAPAIATSNDEVDEDIADALKELLATREVDVSNLLKNQPMQSQASGEPSTIDHELSEDLFDDLDMEPKSEKDDGGNAQPALEGKSSDDILTELELESTVKERAGTAGVAPASPASDEDLADLLSKKMEALVIRLVEERLSAIAERVIREKINKIFQSMK